MLFLIKKKPIEPVAPLSPSWKVGLFLSEPRESAKRSLVYDIQAQQIRKSGNQLDDILSGTQTHRGVERSGTDPTASGAGGRWFESSHPDQCLQGAAFPGALFLFLLRSMSGPGGLPN